jgi:hypothetical protein
MSLCVVPVIAGRDEMNTTNLVLGGLDYIITSTGKKILASDVVTRKGDINFDGKVSTSDARLCLQSVASPLLSQGKVADVNNDGNVSAVDARIILQNVAGITKIDTYATVEKGGSLVIGPLRSSGSTEYYWQCNVDKSELNFFDRLFDKSTTEVVDSLAYQYFVFTPESKGTYILVFKLANAKQTEVTDEFKCILTVK